MLFLKSVMWYLKNRMRKQFFFYEDPNHTVAENILGRSLLSEELWHSQQQLQNHSANFLLQPDGEPWLSLAPGPALSGSAKAAWITQVKSLDSVSHFFVFSYICCFSLDVSKVLIQCIQRSLSVQSCVDSGTKALPFCFKSAQGVQNCRHKVLESLTGNCSRVSICFPMLFKVLVLEQRFYSINLKNFDI